MNILYVVPYVPDPVRARPFNLIRGLSNAGHQVTVATLWTGEAERRSAQALADSCHALRAIELSSPRSLLNSLLALPGRTPLQAVFSWEPKAAHDMAGLLASPNGRRPFDVIHVEHLRGARYGLWLKQRLAERGGPIPLVWDSVDCISHLFRQAARHSRSAFGRWITWLELGRTERYEGMLLGEFDGVLATSATDAAALESLRPPQGGGPPVRVLTNGVDQEYFRPGPESARVPGRIVLSGKMSYHANITMALEFVQRIFPEVRRRHPSAEVWIVGKEPPRSVRRLAQLPGVTVTGTVPDLRPHLQQASLAVAPLVYGAGVQNKVLEAMACATPVVMSGVAARGLDVRHGQEALVADGAEAFAGAVTSLLDDISRQRSIGLAGLRYVTRNHDWRRISGQLLEVYDELVRARG